MIVITSSHVMPYQQCVVTKRLPHVFAVLLYEFGGHYCPSIDVFAVIYYFCTILGGVVAQIQSKPGFCRGKSGQSFLMLQYAKVYEATVAAADTASVTVAGVTLCVPATGVAVTAAVSAPSLAASAVAASGVVTKAVALLLVLLLLLLWLVQMHIVAHASCVR